MDVSWKNHVGITSTIKRLCPGVPLIVQFLSELRSVFSRTSSLRFALDWHVERSAPGKLDTRN